MPVRRKGSGHGPSGKYREQMTLRGYSLLQVPRRGDHLINWQAACIAGP